MACPLRRPWRARCSLSWPHTSTGLTGKNWSWDNVELHATTSPRFVFGHGFSKKRGVLLSDAALNPGGVIYDGEEGHNARDENEWELVVLKLLKE